ncbi:MAG: ThiF family adenylyltransferase [Actinobacteria bacterium]|nr:ThiF family adenylyltransferase [Actinomycetota bacterium]
MLRRLLDHNPSIQRLVDEGYHVGTEGGYLFIHDVPYVTSSCKIERATIADQLSGDIDSIPADHTIWFTGSDPCDANGNVLTYLARPCAKTLIDGINAQHQFSQKPAIGPQNYGDHYKKMVTYIGMLEGQAMALDPNVTARTFHPIEDDDEASPFKYLDTASTRAGIVLATSRLKMDRVAIVGLGGTGSYILDQLAKLPIQEIHLFDPDTFNQHNAFRTPGAASLDQLNGHPKKVDYLKALYEPMRSGIFSHPVPIDESNVALLTDMNFVFMAFDGGPAKAALISHLTAINVPFIDVGMGLKEKDGQLVGQVRMSSITGANQERATDQNFIPCSDPEENEYDFNVQVADMNAMSALLAVIRFKKILGFYKDFEDSPYYVYGIFDNSIIAEAP